MVLSTLSNIFVGFCKIFLIFHYCKYTANKQFTAYFWYQYLSMLLCYSLRTPVTQPYSMCPAKLKAGRSQLIDTSSARPSASSTALSSIV